ncbi:MAG: FlgD immunoglobulin-like domain containing protein [Armatimonadota bacterium]
MNFAGVSAEAADGLDVGDVMEPPPISGAVNLYFPHSNWAEESGRYLQDLQSPRAATLKWRFEVDSNLTNSDVVLTWDLMNAPRTKVFVLRDLDAGEQVFMRTQTSYVFRTGAEGSVRHFELIAGDQVAGALKITDLQILPTRGGGSEISFNLSVPAEVTADLLNIAGRRIRRIADRKAVASGRSSLVWDGRNQAGMMVPAGTYICRVVAQTTQDRQQASQMRQFVVMR